MSRLRVAFVQLIVPHYRLPVFDALAAAPEIELTVIADGEQPEGSLESVPHLGSFPFEHAPWRRLRSFVSQPALLAAARSKRFDAIILPWNTRIVQLFPALLAARRRGVRTVLFGHGFSKRESAVRRRLRNAALACADAALLYGEAAIGRLVEEGFPRTKLFLARNAIDQRPIQRARAEWLDDPERLDAFRRAERIVGRELAVFVSRLEPDKRVDLLLRAFAELRRRRPAARLALIGKGSQTEALRALAAELGVADATSFAGALYDDRELAPWMLSAAAFAFPAAIGLSILHALGYGLPVVTSDDLAAHNPEIEALRPEVNGLLYRDGDPVDFAAKLDVLMEGGEAWQRMSEAAHRTVLGPDGYSVERMVEGIVEAVRPR
ncbi:MAG TPA: glycosyltransferase [Phycisphaerales bacterium]|nr:glycosyltransferase [Phycisphaerales bacterium]HMP38094.1 glycosyltransferase [Phycisphaerales bacterium]